MRHSVFGIKRFSMLLRSAMLRRSGVDDARFEGSARFAK